MTLQDRASHAEVEAQGMLPAGPPSGVPAGPPPGRDPISGALNISGVGQAYGRLVSTAVERDLAIWFIDVRNFRAINPKYGYDRGNVVLQTLTRCLTTDLAGELPVGRVGGDRFVILTSGISAEEAEGALIRTAMHITDEVAAMGISHTIVLAAGVYYLRPHDYERPDMQRALDYASIAHRNARTSSASCVFLFSDEDLERDMRRITIEQSIEAALAEGQIQVWYQPQVDYLLGEVVGAEALARWRHPELGWIEPTEFIPALENCGKVHDLDLFVWEEACKSAGRWHGMADSKPVPISVNISRAELFEPDLVEHFIELQRKYDLPEGSLHLEVTESTFAEDTERLCAIIERMSENHLPIEMDNFGVGLSSLNVLRDVPVDVVKIDLGFINAAAGEERGGVVLASLIRMLQGLDTPIIAEGVETHEQAELLKNMGCHLMQGYHFGRPMPHDDFENFVATNRAVEHARHRTRHESKLDELLSVDPSTSYFFNYAMGGLMLVVVRESSSEVLLANDRFYEDCGMVRGQSGNAWTNPFGEIEKESRATLWRAATEAREHGSAFCRLELTSSQRWIDCVVRFVSESARGQVFLLNVTRSGALADGFDLDMRLMQDAVWSVETLNGIAPNGFVKCGTGEGLPISYLSPVVYRGTKLKPDEFAHFFHNSLLEFVDARDRQTLADAVEESLESGAVVSVALRVRHGYGSLRHRVQLVGRVRTDEEGVPWFYALMVDLGDDATTDVASRSDEVVSFDYEVASDRLTMRDPAAEGGMREVVLEDFLHYIESVPEFVAPNSAVKVRATMRDLSHHPTTGYIDIKCNLRRGRTLRWYHVDYTCDADEAGNTVMVHGYARSANDQRGSARWWRRQAETDQLTGLLNRNAVEQEINLAMRTQGAGMMFMIDLDGFKRINDELGHLVGDALLRDVAAAIASTFREGDVIGRYGGDEFVAFMPVMGWETDDLGERRATDIVSAVSRVTAGDGTHAACSVGVAICHDREATFYDLLEVADGAMYQSKERGKGTYTIVEMS